MRPYSRADAEDDLRDALEQGDLTGAFAACRAIDHSDPPGSLVTMLGAGLWYAEQGLPVFPVMAADKRPYPGTRGLKDASTDGQQITAALKARPGCNIAIATGHVYDVIDVDGPLGNLTLARELLDACPCSEAASCALHEPSVAPDDPYAGIRGLAGVVSTPRPGGRHLYVPASGRGNTAGMDGVDYRGLGGYVVVPPSVTPAGAYVWTRPLAAKA